MERIKANELRIGNYLIDSKNRLCLVDSIKKEIDECGIYAIKDCITSFPIEPIPLTEEWLVNFGFDVKYYDNLPWYEKGCLTLDAWFDVERNDATTVRIEYVHQLQNLYFALTGEELIIQDYEKNPD